MIHLGNADHGDLLMRRIGSRYSKVTMEVISRSEDGVLYGGVVYENYTGKGGSILVHTAGFTKHWINKDMLWIMFDYPFRQLDCKQAFAQVPGNNTDCIKFSKAVGWEEVIRLPAVYPDDDMILFRLYRDRCRFMNLKPSSIKPCKGLQNGQA